MVLGQAQGLREIGEIGGKSASVWVCDGLGATDVGNSFVFLCVSFGLVLGRGFDGLVGQLGRRLDVDFEMVVNDLSAMKMSQVYMLGGALHGDENIRKAYDDHNGLGRSCPVGAVLLFCLKIPLRELFISSNSERAPPATNTTIPQTETPPY